jgi:hypothetical protein
MIDRVGFARRESDAALSEGRESPAPPPARVADSASMARITGSSEIRVGESAGGEDHLEPVVGWVAEASGDAAVELDDAVDGFGAAVAGASGGEVGQELFAPGTQCSAEAGDLGDRAGVERFQHGQRDLLALVQVLRRERRAEALVAGPCEGDLPVRVAGFESGLDPGHLGVR